MEELLMEALRVVTDPEIGINIVDLGLIYDVKAQGDHVDIKMTMTTPTCPLHAIITRDVETVVKGAFPHIRSVDIELVWDPPWNPEMMKPAAKKQLGWA